MIRCGNSFLKYIIALCVVTVASSSGAATADQTPLTSERIFEWTIESQKTYTDPFNDVDVDVVFENNGQLWRVPTFWDGGSRWTVRFAPPFPGRYTFRLESTDRDNADLNGNQGTVTITGYTGNNELLGHGALTVSANRRYLVYADGTPFYWLGDTWWTGLSDRISWEGFQKLTADRRAKGFSVVQICGGLVPSNEELAPVDPGFHNEGGYVWDEKFERINPKYFDYADRRIQYLVENGIAPAIVGGWHQVLAQMGVAKMKKHWRYLVARYGAYPVLWIVGGEVYDPPPGAEPPIPFAIHHLDLPGGWSEVARYLRGIDPYHHPITVHEGISPFPLQDQALTDFDLAQASHFGWASIAIEVAQITARYARSTITKPVIEGEVAYEQLAGWQGQDTQRAAFWLAMLNGAAGYTYGVLEISGAYTADKPLHRERWSLFNWEEAMNFPGSTQISLNAKLLRRYSWQRFTPHPEWVLPRGTTLLDGNAEIPHVTRDVAVPYLSQASSAMYTSPVPSESAVPRGEWQNHEGTFRLPYAAGIPGEVRFVYMPYFGPLPPDPVTVLHLEPGLRYSAYLWDPSLGVKIDMGTVQRPEPGRVIFHESAQHQQPSLWVNAGSPFLRNARDNERQHPDQVISIVKSVNARNLVASVEAKSGADIALIFRYQNPKNYVSAVYSNAKRLIFIERRNEGNNRPPLGAIAVGPTASRVRLSAEVRDNFAMAVLTDGRHVYSTPIVSLNTYDSPIIDPSAGTVGVMHFGARASAFADFVVRESPVLAADQSLERRLYDASGAFRGVMNGTTWDTFGRDKTILLDAYRPQLPYRRDWILVLETPQSRAGH